MRIAFLCASDPGKRSQLASLWCCWQPVDPQRCRSLSSEWRHKVLDQATKVPLVLVPDGGVQPRYAPPHQIGRQGNSFDGNHLRRLRIAANVSPAPIATKMWLRSPTFSCGLTARESAQARSASCTNRSTVTTPRSPLLSDVVSWAATASVTASPHATAVPDLNGAVEMVNPMANAPYKEFARRRYANCCPANAYAAGCEADRSPLVTDGD